MTDFSDAVAKYLKVNSVGVPEMFQFTDRKNVRNMLANDNALSPQERKRLLKTYDMYVDSVVNRPRKMEEGGEVNGDNKLIGGQKKLDKNKDGKISGADFKMMKYGGEVKSKPKKRTVKKKTSMTSRGAGAALRGTKFVGVR